jgi:hypothetical protein
MRYLFTLIMAAVWSVHATAQTVDAFAWKSPTFRPEYSRGLYVKIQETSIVAGEDVVRVLCALDGAGEIIVGIRGAFMTANGAARRWKDLWIVTRGQLVRVADSNWPDVPSTFKFIKPHIGKVIDAGNKLCPMALPALDATAQAITEAAENYRTQSRRLQISVP